MSESEEGTDGAPRRRGRPAGAKGSFTFRIAPALRAQLETSAASAGRTLSEEVESRLEQSVWAEAIKAQEKEEAERFSPDAYIKRLKIMCGGEEGFDFAMALGDHMKLVRIKNKIDPEADILTLPEDKRYQLAKDFASALPSRFGLWDLEVEGQNLFDVLVGSGRLKINSPQGD